jgi:hypothetical protein
MKSELLNEKHFFFHMLDYLATTELETFCSLWAMPVSLLQYTFMVSHLQLSTQQGSTLNLIILY